MSALLPVAVCERGCWDPGQLAAAEAASKIDVKQVKKVNLTELLATFLVEARKPRRERTEEEKATLSAWFAKAAWFVALRRAGRA